MQLTDYRTLGRSGLSVSPLALGTMTFGTARWGTDDSVSEEIFRGYVERGGNLIDSADVYASGRSEEMIGRFVSAGSLRDQLILSTKAGFAAGKGPHAGGIGAKHLRSSLEGSLKRLLTDYIDLYWAHVWDGITPAEELLGTMSALVNAGKIRYWGMSNAPAWYVSRLVTLAAMHGQPGPVALQNFYSLVDREIEREHVPLASEAGLGIMPWSPLAYGLLTGKYRRDSVKVGHSKIGGLPTGVATSREERPTDDKRMDGANPFGDSLFTEKNWKIVDTLVQVAERMGESPAKVALAWVLGREQIVSTLIGVSRMQQLEDNVAALNVTLDQESMQALDGVSAGTPSVLYGLFTPELRRAAIFGGASVSGTR